MVGLPRQVCWIRYYPCKKAKTNCSKFHNIKIQCHFNTWTIWDSLNVPFLQGYQWCSIIPRSTFKAAIKVYYTLLGATSLTRWKNGSGILVLKKASAFCKENGQNFLIGSHTIKSYLIVECMAVNGTNL